MIVIVMATYNGEPYLREQLDSLFQNTCQDWRLYVFDDGSADRTLEIVEDYQKAHPGRVEIRRNPENLRSARNFFSGLRQVWEETAADYYMFCDQDDCWDTDKIERSLQTIRRLEKKEGKQTPLLIYTDSRLTEETGRVIEPSFQRASHYRRISAGENLFAHLLMENTMPGCTQMMNRALVDRAFLKEGFPDGLKMHDWWFGLVAACFGRIGYLDRATMSYRQHSGNVVGGVGFASYVKSRLAGIGRLRQTIREDIRQGEAFSQWYGQEAGEEEREVLNAFCEMGRAGFVRKRLLFLRYQFWKSGLVRNVALFLLL